MDKRIVVVGSSNTDMVVKSGRLPGPGETVIGGDFQTFAGGKGANQAVAAARAGAAVTLVAALGTDSLGDAALEGFRREGIDLACVKRAAGAASGVAVIIVSESGENLIAVAPGANALLTPADLETVDFGRFGVAVFQLETPIETVVRGLELAREAGCTTILNPAPAAPLPARVFPLTDFFTPNQHELELYGAGADGAGTLEDKARAVLGRGCGCVLVTCGADGVVVVGPDACQRVASPKVSAVDAVGAGDCFTGCLAAALARGESPAEAVAYACHAAALSVQRAGAQPSFPTAERIRLFMAERRAAG